MGLEKKKLKLSKRDRVGIARAKKTADCISRVKCDEQIMAAGQLFHEIIAHLRSTMSHIFSVGEKAKEIWNTVENSSIIGMWVSHHVLQTIHTSMLGEQKNNPSSRRKVHKS